MDWIDLDYNALQCRIAANVLINNRFPWTQRSSWPDEPQPVSFEKFCSFALATNSNSLPLTWSRKKCRVLKLNIPFTGNNQFVRNTKEQATASIVAPQDGATLLKQAKLSTAGDESRNQYTRIRKSNMITSTCTGTREMCWRPYSWGGPNCCELPVRPLFISLHSEAQEWHKNHCLLKEYTTFPGGRDSRIKKDEFHPTTCHEGTEGSGGIALHFH
jgi:hypothetical protein